MILRLYDNLGQFRDALLKKDGVGTEFCDAFLLIAHVADSQWVVGG
jgi:endonuclease III-like uncharacterized protein